MSALIDILFFNVLFREYYCISLNKQIKTIYPRVMGSIRWWGCNVLSFVATCLFSQISIYNDLLFMHNHKTFSEAWMYTYILIRITLSHLFEHKVCMIQSLYFGTCLSEIWGWIIQILWMKRRLCIILIETGLYY